jgi:type I restriction enzyme S subunit
MTETRTLGDLIEAGVIEATNGFPFGGHNSDGSGVPHIRPFNVATNGSITLEQIKSIPLEAALNRPRLRRGDVVFNNTNTKELVGKCALWDQETDPVFSNHMTRIRVNEDACDPGFLSFAILHHWIVGKSEMLARAHVAQASIMGERFREIEVPWPHVATQRAIAMTIATVRAACRSDVLQEEHAARLKAATQRELFSRGLRGEGQKESAIGLIPESWDVVSLGGLGRVGNGSTPKKTVPSYWDGGTYPWLTSAKVYDRDIVAADQFVTEEALRECHLPRIAPGAVLIAITGQGKTLGHCAVLRTEATISQHIAYLATDTSRADPSFVRGYLETQYEYLRQVASGGGSTKGALTCAFLRELPLPLPSIMEEQREIVAILDALDRKIDLHRRKRNALEALFKSVLHKLMLGEVSVEDVADRALVQQAPPLRAEAVS